MHGGTTTIIDFALVGDGDNVQQAIERRQKEWAGDCHCDYAFHTMVQGKLPPELMPQLAEAVQAGHPSVKIFTTDITPSRKGRMVDFGDIWEVLKVLAQGRRHRRDPRRGQRPRHAHVREAHPRGADRL